MRPRAIRVKVNIPAGRALFFYILFLFLYTLLRGTLFSHPSVSLGKVSRIAPSRDRTEAGTLRKRAQRACRECHAHKTKCSGDLPRCKRCEANDLLCEYTPSKRKFTHAPGSQSYEIQADDPDYDFGAALPPVEDDAKQVVSPTAFSGSSAYTSQTRRSSIVEQLYGEYVQIPLHPCLSCLLTNEQRSPCQTGPLNQAFQCIFPVMDHPTLHGHHADGANFY